MHAGVGSIGIAAAMRSALVCGEPQEDGGPYLLAHVKSSEEATAQTVAYRLTRHAFANGSATVKIELEGSADVSALDVLNGPRQGESGTGEATDAREFLERVLCDGPMLKADVMKAADQQRIGRTSLFKARKALGIVSDVRPEDAVPRNYWKNTWGLPQGRTPEPL